jgi:hypothetical protein
LSPGGADRWRALSARVRAGGRNGARARRARLHVKSFTSPLLPMRARTHSFFSSAAVGRPNRAVAKDSGPPPPAVASRGARRARGARGDPDTLPGWRAAASARMWRPRCPATASSAANGHAPLRGRPRGTPRRAARARAQGKRHIAEATWSSLSCPARAAHARRGPCSAGGRAAHCTPPISKRRRGARHACCGERRAVHAACASPASRCALRWDDRAGAPLQCPRRDAL